MTVLEQSLRSAQKLAQGGQWSGALGVLNDVSPQDTYRADYKVFRARILLGMGRDADALSDIDEADGGAASPRLLALRAEVEEKLGRVEAAIHTLTRALEEEQNPAFLARRAILLQAMGQFDDARDDLDMAIKRKPHEGELYRLLSTQHRFKKDDSLLEQLRQNAAKFAKGSPERMGFEFAQAKALDDLGEYDAAYAHLERANATMRAAYPYNIQVRLDHVQRYMDRFDQFDPTQHVAADASDYAPIFVTGLPRSGTTLVEQILSSHAHVQAGGETARFLPHMISTIGDPVHGDMNLSPEKFAVLGQKYHADMLTRLHIAKRHTDKSIQTILYAGAVCAALPRAKIIVVTRNPHATALSLLRHVFRPGKQLFSYSLEDIRTYQRSYEEIIAFWQHRLPDAVLPISYEDVVTHPQETIRQMLEFAGLDWDPACLHPEKNNRAVQTLSAISVRSPIAQGARDHWRNYERFLTDAT
ncbi:MAG: sulfotransferase [Pseudomonadota bacterium]